MARFDSEHCVTKLNISPEWIMEMAEKESGCDVVAGASSDGFWFYTKPSTHNLEVLIRARERIADHDHWCQGCAAKDADGRRCMSTSEKAARWCAFGSLIAEREPWLGCGVETVYSFLNDAANLLYNENAAFVNDTLGHEAVLKVYDLAIQTESERLASLNK